MSKYIERIENLIRVVSNVSDDKFDIRRWWNPLTSCGCALGHAMHDPYFADVLDIDLGHKDVMKKIGEYFGVNEERSKALFINQVGYGSRKDVLSALRVLLLETMAQEITSKIGGAEAQAYMELVEA